MGVRIFGWFLIFVPSSMSELYGRLSRLFPEVSPLYSVPMKKRRSKKPAGGLFAEPSELGYVQVLPGLFEERPRTGSKENHCFFVLDAPTAMLFPGTTADFAEAEFRYPLYQIPFYAGLTDRPNIDLAQAADEHQNELMAQAGRLDDALQSLIRTVAGSSLPPALARALIEQLRVWSIEDYSKSAYLKQITSALTELTNQIYTYTPPAVQARQLKEEIANAKKRVESMLAQISDQQNPWAAFADALIQAFPNLEEIHDQQTVFSLINQAACHRVSLQNTKNPNIDWYTLISTKQMSVGHYVINNLYTTFAHSQLR